MMQRRNPFSEQVLFEARLSPHRSLSFAGFTILMLALAGISFAIGVTFLMLGAWPVFGFLGLDVALVWFAFRVNYWEARAYEDIRMTSNLLSVCQVSARGQARVTNFNPRWTKLEKIEDDLSGTTRVALISRDIALIIGAFLPPFHKSELAKTLSSALAIAKR